MKNRRLIGMIILFAFLTVALTCFLVDRMIVRRGVLLSARYEDKRLIALMNQLIVEGVFQVREGQMFVDEGKLLQKRFDMDTAASIRRHIPYLYIKNNRIFFENHSTSIVNVRQRVDDFVIRGRFLDRNGVMLAKSVLDSRTNVVKREYPYGPVLYPIIGHDHVVFGKRNLEKILDSYLMGESHAPVYRETANPLRKARLGDDVVLTIDSRIQKAAFDAMAGKKGAVVVLDVRTGEVLAAVSLPAFDPGTKADAVWRTVFRDTKNRPYENRAFSALYSPGSTFKVVVASAWLEKTKGDEAQEKKQIFCTGKKNRHQISDIYPHGMVQIDKAFTESCNIYFSEIGVMLGKNMARYAARFGFGQKSNLTPHIPGVHFDSARSVAFAPAESAGAEEAPGGTFDFTHNPKIVAQGAIGQNVVNATPLQMAMVAASVANDGLVLSPNILKEIKMGGGDNMLFSAGKAEAQQAIHKETAKTIKDLMIGVMNKGTGKKVKKIFFQENHYTTTPDRADVETVPIAGKTGTAEVGDKNDNEIVDADEKPHSWFIGFAPADKPRFAIAVVAENQGFGSLVAAPIAMEVLAAALNYR